MELTDKQLDDLEPIVYGREGETWPRTTVDLFDTIKALKAELRQRPAPGGMTEAFKEWWAKNSCRPWLTAQETWNAAWQACGASQQAEIDAVVGEFAKLMNALEPELKGPPKNVPKSSWAAQWDAAEAICRAHGWKERAMRLIDVQFGVKAAEAVIINKILFLFDNKLEGAHTGNSTDEPEIHFLEKDYETTLNSIRALVTPDAQSALAEAIRKAKLGEAEDWNANVNQDDGLKWAAERLAALRSEAGEK